jgi:hypothetical protein
LLGDYVEEAKIETLRESAFKVRYVGLPQCIKLGGLYLRDYARYRRIATGGSLRLYCFVMEDVLIPSGW